MRATLYDCDKVRELKWAISQQRKQKRKTRVADSDRFRALSASSERKFGRRRKFWGNFGFMYEKIAYLDSSISSHFYSDNAIPCLRAQTPKGSFSWYQRGSPECPLPENLLRMLLIVNRILLYFSQINSRGAVRGEEDALVEAKGLELRTEEEMTHCERFLTLWTQEAEKNARVK